MTTRGKIVFTLLLLAVVGFGSYRWWDKIAPAAKSPNVSVNPQVVQKALKDPLSHILSFEYHVAGTWTTPSVTRRKHDPQSTPQAGRK